MQLTAQGMTMSDDLMGLAAAARKAKDPAVTVTSLREAIESGRLPHEKGIGGIRLVRLSDVKSLAITAPVVASPETPRKSSVKLPRRRAKRSS
jgi:hypothetical protein